MSRLPQYYLSYPLVPGEKAVDGIRFDFCDGCRILFQQGSGEHRVILTDADSGCVLQNTLCCDGAKFRSDIRYYVKWKIDIYKDEALIFSHRMDLRGREVLFNIGSDLIGDTIAWFPYVDKFQKRHGCKAGVIMSKLMRPLFECNYPNVVFFDRGAEKMLQPYASFFLGINYECNPKMQKRSFNCVPMHHLIGYDLGFDDDIDIMPPRLAKAKISLPEEPYVCLSIRGSQEYKNWHNTAAVAEVIDWLKSRKYRVLVVDKDNHGLWGGEDATGPLPLTERATLIGGAKCFIGGGAGLSWLSWACGVPVVLVAGFSEPWSEFYTPYRVQNANVCHGCWNNRAAFLSCKGKSNEYECSKMITSKMIIEQLKRVL